MFGWRHQLTKASSSGAGSAESLSSAAALSESDRRVASDAGRCGSAAMTPPSIPRLLALDAAAHASELLAYLQGPGGRTGTIAASELAHMHGEMCDALEIERLGWCGVSRELRRLLSQSKLYVDRAGRRMRAFRIPPAGDDLRPRAASRWATPAAGEQGVNLPPARAA